MEKFTREALRMMRDGETKTFQCSDAAQVYSAASNTSSAQKVLGCKFSCEKHFNENTITITRLPMGVTKL